MQELVTNLHIHTQYSDGTGTPSEVLEAATQAGLDVVITTDHNVYISGIDRYLQTGQQRTLLIAGEEIHNPTRDPQKSHLLVMGVNKDLSHFAEDPQELINQVKKNGGICFLAHPYENALALFNESDISWDDWQVTGYTGLELWNGLSEIKNVIHSPLSALFYALNPRLIAHGPDLRTLARWDDLLKQGQRVYAVGGADAHALKMSMGPLKRTIFPYAFHFSAINTHIFTPTGLTGDLARDKQMVFQAFRSGHTFVGYDLAASTRGFRFSAQGKDCTAWMGDEIKLNGGVTLQARLPFAADVRLMVNGAALRTWRNTTTATLIVNEPGAYRIEAYTQYQGKMRGWIFSNPIFVKA
ncbi:hypothetical protein ADN00_11890 [Ornatilinea apprima]|uniref:Polymerase/histidinol phosphatase N-terminal domain-containing protein n=1 Tax=Ornatilinea apprima TaxID=1134406 RepID=A0A0N8GMR7_9CHLR|nr:CehA/McbA family metallohydrolase [Ornatilinea apprima]KPL76050.1 hypothetical protein ADN00_11890 [Ornatilinea apprima]